MDVFFSVIMVNSCKGYSRSFSFVLLMCVVSAASLQVMVDHGRKQQENQRFSVGVFAPHRLNRDLELNVCGVQCIELFHCFTSSTTAQKQTFSFSLFLAKKDTISISSHCIASCLIAPHHSYIQSGNSGSFFTE